MPTNGGSACIHVELAEAIATPPPLKAPWRFEQVFSNGFQNQLPANFLHPLIEHVTPLEDGSQKREKGSELPEDVKASWIAPHLANTVVQAMADCLGRL